MKICKKKGEELLKIKRKFIRHAVLTDDLTKITEEELDFAYMLATAGDDMNDNLQGGIVRARVEKVEGNQSTKLAEKAKKLLEKKREDSQTHQ